MVRIIINVGAGDGNQCTKWLRIDKQLRVYAIDPEPKKFKSLRAAANSVHFRQRFFAYSMAIFSFNGMATFYHCNDPSSGSLLPFVKANVKKWKYPSGRRYFNTIEKSQVKTQRLDTFFAERKLNVVDMIKIEVQGYGLQVIKSIGRKIRGVKEVIVKVHTVNFDVYKDQSKKRDIITYMKSKGFDLYSTTPYSRNQEEFLRFRNQLFKFKISINYIE